MWIEALAAAAEEGYAPTASSMRETRGQTKLVPVRMPPGLKSACEQRAKLESTSLSEIVRAAVRLRLRASAAT